MIRADTGYTYDLLRRIGTAFLTPVRFSLRTGHFRSSLARRALDPAGNYLPWYTYPAIDFLSTIDLTGQSVLEFGGGHSTVWWAQRAQHVFSIENDAGWFQFISEKLGQQPNVEFFLCTDLQEYADKPRGRQFDVIVIDGGNRYLCAEASIACLRERGAVIMDNSEGFWGGEENRTYPIIELYSNAGFMRVDFYGYAPGVIKPHCTSIFFKDNARLFERLPPPVRKH